MQDDDDNPDDAEMRRLRLRREDDGTTADSGPPPGDPAFLGRVLPRLDLAPTTLDPLLPTRIPKDTYFRHQPVFVTGQLVEGAPILLVDSKSPPVVSAAMGAALAGDLHVADRVKYRWKVFPKCKQCLPLADLAAEAYYTTGGLGAGPLGSDVPVVNHYYFRGWKVRYLGLNNYTGLFSRTRIYSGMLPTWRLQIPGNTGAGGSPFNTFPFPLSLTTNIGLPPGSVYPTPLVINCVDFVCGRGCGPANRLVVARFYVDTVYFTQFAILFPPDNPEYRSNFPVGDVVSPGPIPGPNPTAPGVLAAPPYGPVGPLGPRVQPVEFVVGLGATYPEFPVAFGSPGGVVSITGLYAGP